MSLSLSLANPALVSQAPVTADSPDWSGYEQYQAQLHIAVVLPDAGEPDSKTIGICPDEIGLVAVHVVQQIKAGWIRDGVVEDYAYFEPAIKEWDAAGFTPGDLAYTINLSRVYNYTEPNSGVEPVMMRRTSCVTC